MSVATYVSTTVADISSQYQIDMTLDDPTQTYKLPSGSTVVHVFQSSQFTGISTGIVATNVNQYFTIKQPVAAIRITSGSSTCDLTMAVLQSGIG